MLRDLLPSSRGSEKFKNVYYPGLKSHPHFELATKQQLSPYGKPGYGGMISIELDCIESARKFVKGLEIFTLAESLGGVELSLSSSNDDTCIYTCRRSQ